MADATYDAVIIGAGNKALILAMYLAKYGGMDVALFESRHEAGGGWSGEESPAPGFMADTHATGCSPVYHIPVEMDFPEWKELGGIYSTAKCVGGVFREDDSCLLLYGITGDPKQEQTAKSIARFSERDAEAWLKLDELWWNVISPAFLEWLHTPPPPPGEPDALERVFLDPKSGIDPSWAVKSPLEVFRDLFESDALISFLLGFFYHIIPCSPDMPGMGFQYLQFLRSNWGAGVVGGMHSWAHAATKIILANGGKIFLQKEVDKVLIENGTAAGIRFTDGTEVRARKLVVSTLDPHTLCFRLIGKEHLDAKLLKKVENLERRITCVAWYTWALHERPEYKAASFDPDINEASRVYLVTKDPTTLIREEAMLLAGKMPDDWGTVEIVQHPQTDKTRVPEGKFSILTSQFVLPANALTEEQWLEFKKSNAESVVKLLQKHAPNMTWDNIIGYVPLTPYDCCQLANMAPFGNWAVIDMTTSQIGRFRPVPELASSRTPVKNLYATGSAWHPYGEAACWQAYICYKVIAQDLGLGKPWEGRPW